MKDKLLFCENILVGIRNKDSYEIGLIGILNLVIFRSSNTFNNINYLMVARSNSHLIYQIVNHLRSAQQVPHFILTDLFSQQSQQLSAYAGLINLFYNQALSVKQNHISTQTGPFNVGNVLKLRGEILREYGKFLSDHINEPAYSLITFDYKSFTRFCSDRGLGELLHHSKGIYPEIDTVQKVPLQFLPFYDDLQGKNPVLVGNRNWKLAKKILDIYYDQHFNNDLSMINQKGNIENEDSQRLKIGIKLSFLILAEKQKQLQSYIQKYGEYVNNQLGEDEARIKIHRVNFWYKNFLKFRRQAAEYYESKNQFNQVPFLYDLHQSNFEDNIMSLIIKVTEARFNQTQNGICFKSLKHQLAELIHYIYANSEMSKEVKLLFLAYVQAIIKITKVEIEDNESPKKAFTSLLNFTQGEQPFYKLFYSDNEILNFYQRGEIKSYPTEYTYGPQITPKILKAFIQNNPESLVDNLHRVNSLDLIYQLRLFVENSLIGDLDRVNFEDLSLRTPGQVILAELDKNKGKFKSLFVNNEGETLRPSLALQRLTSFIVQWKSIYEVYRMMDIKLFRRQVMEYSNAITERCEHFAMTKVHQMRQQDPFNEQQLTSPYNRPDTAYFLINRFVSNLNDQRFAYNNMKLAKYPDRRALQNLQNKIKQSFQLFGLEEFKNVVMFLDVPYNQQIFSTKEEFENFVWKVYSQISLTLSNMSKQTNEIERQVGSYDCHQNESSLDEAMDQEESEQRQVQISD